MLFVDDETQDAAKGFVLGNVQIKPVLVIVEGGEAGGLQIVLGLEVEQGFGFATEMLDAPSDEALLVGAAEREASVEAQPAGAFAKRKEP